MELTFIYTPVNHKPPLAVLVSRKEKILVKEARIMLLRSLGIKEVSISRVPLAVNSRDKIYSLLGDFEIVKGSKAMNRFIYGFELSDSPHTYICTMCHKMCDCELKKHVENNCFFVMCDVCVTKYFKCRSEPLECPVCFTNVKAWSFIKIGESVPAISILNVPVVLCGLLTNGSVDNSNSKLGESRLFKLRFEDNEDTVSHKGEYTVHFIDQEDHECIECFHDEDCSSEYEDDIFKKTYSQPEVDYDGIPASSSIHNSVSDEQKPIFQEQKPILSVESKLFLQEQKPILPDLKPIFQEEKPILSELKPILQDINPVLQEHKSISQPDISERPNAQSNNDGMFKSIFEETKFENILKQFQTHRNNTLKLFREESEKVVKEGLQDLTEEFEKVLRTLENRPLRNLHPFENLKFSGKKDFQNPVRFIEDFEFFANRERLNDYEKQYFFGQCLKEDASQWLKIYGYGQTYEDMKNSFLDFFWSTDDQNSFRTFLKRGKYKKDSGLSMYVYFHKYAYEAKYLDKVPEEETLTKWLSEHFDFTIQSKLFGNHVKTTSQALRLLKSLETFDLNGNCDPETPYNFFSSSTSKKSKTGVWEDYVGNKYEGIKKDGEMFHRCITEKIWPLHSLSYNNSQTDIKHFDVYCDEDSSKLLSNVPCHVNYVYIDVNGIPVEHKVLGPITIARQNGKQLIVSTCPSFKSFKKMISGQLLYILIDGYYKPCSIITCSIPEDIENRYVIPNNNEQIVCLSCRDKIEEVQFRESRHVAVEDLVVRYFEQRFKKRKHILRFLNATFCTVYTVWDDAVDEYNPLKPTYH